MLERILKLYTMAMLGDVRSPMPHLFGPPGCGKSTVVEQAAALIGVHLHILNVSRLSPLDVEGVQMPHGKADGEMWLRMLPATFWTQLEEGDIVLLDEFLRGFPEVYNALLDILTSRRVGAFRLPKVFIIGASNSTVAYDKALEDRLHHIPVPDPRKSKPAKKQLAQLMVDQIGLLPDMADSFEMTQLLDTEVLPMFEILDGLGKASSAPGALKGSSLRNLIGQAQLRDVESAPLKELIDMNNTRARAANKEQYVVLLGGKNVTPDLSKTLRALRGNSRLSTLQALNLELNLQLLELEEIRRQKGINENDDVFLNF